MGKFKIPMPIQNSVKKMFPEVLWYTSRMAKQPPRMVPKITLLENPLMLSVPQNFLKRTSEMQWILQPGILRKIPVLSQ